MRTVHVKRFHRKDGTYVRPHDKQIRGPARRSRIPQRTVFFKSKVKKYADIVSLRSYSEAKESTDELLDEFKQAKTRGKKRYVKRSTVLAGTRAKIMSENKRLNPSTRRQKRRIYGLYMRTANKMKLD